MFNLGTYSPTYSTQFKQEIEKTISSAMENIGMS
jgi:hypothetical protein